MEQRNNSGTHQDWVVAKVVKLGKSFGFVRSEISNLDVFFHASIVSADGFGNLAVGQRVHINLEVNTSNGKLMATSVRPVNQAVPSFVISWIEDLVIGLVLNMCEGCCRSVVVIYFKGQRPKVLVAETSQYSDAIAPGAFVALKFSNPKQPKAFCGPGLNRGRIHIVGLLWQAATDETLAKKLALLRLASVVIASLPSAM